MEHSPRAGPAASPEETPVGEQGMPVVLVVEDEPLILLAACDLVECAGFLSIEASNADRALRILEADPNIAVVFTDIDMPGSMDGLTLAALVRRRWPEIGVIVTSGRWAWTEGALPEGSVFFEKPYLDAEILAVMNSMVA